jgi:hypothetical protein
MFKSIPFDKFKNLSTPEQKEYVEDLFNELDKHIEEREKVSRKIKKLKKANPTLRKMAS